MWYPVMTITVSSGLILSKLRSKPISSSCVSSRCPWDTPTSNIFKWNLTSLLFTATTFFIGNIIRVLFSTIESMAVVCWDDIRVTFGRNTNVTITTTVWWIYCAFIMGGMVVRVMMVMVMALEITFVSYHCAWKCIASADSSFNTRRSLLRNFLSQQGYHITDCSILQSLATMSSKTNVFIEK